MVDILITVFALFAVLSFSFFLMKSLKVVPQQEVWVVQRVGKFHRLLKAGLHFVTPFVDLIAYKHSLKEEAIDVHEQTAVTQDNVSVVLDGILYVKIIDPIAASYGVKNPHYALTQLVQTTMRSEIGKLPLDKCFEEREALNAHIVNTINEASASWGIQCLRYEVKDITMPADIRKAMELQMTAERQKRARILESEGLKQSEINDSEGKRQAQINIAEGNKQRVILESEAALLDKINRAKGESEAISILAEATSKGLDILAASLQKQGGDQAASMKVAEQYIDAFKALAKHSTTLILPSDSANIGSMLTQAMSIFDTIKTKKIKDSLPPTFSEKF